MEYKTCTIKELYEHFKMLGKEDYKLYIECLTVNGETTNACVVLKNATINNEQKRLSSDIQYRLVKLNKQEK